MSHLRVSHSLVGLCLATIVGHLMSHKPCRTCPTTFVGHIFVYITTTKMDMHTSLVQASKLLTCIKIMIFMFELSL